LLSHQIKLNSFEFQFFSFVLIHGGAPTKNSHTQKSGFTAVSVNSTELNSITYLHFFFKTIWSKREGKEGII